MNITTKLTLCDEPTTAALEEAVRKTLVSGTNSLLILASDSDNWDPDKVDRLLRSLKVPVFGGVFPCLIFEGKQHKQGTLVVGLDFTPEIVMVENLSQSKESIDQQLAENALTIANAAHLITIVDGLTENIERLTEELYAITGKNSTVIGCGAGSIDFVQRPCLFTNNGMIFDAALIAVIPIPFNFGLSHGWEVLEGPFLVTKSEGATLETLNYSPAFEVYKEHVEKNSRLTFAEHEYFELAKTYPLGIENIEGEILVRDPVVVEGNSLVCVGEVPENSIIYLLKGTPSNLIAAAGEAAKVACDTRGVVEEERLSVVLFDCISRSLFLEKDFDKELESIKENLDGVSDIFGALTVGEIANSKHGPIEWLNRSTVVAVF